MSEYDSGPAGDTRRAVADGSFQLANDPEKIVAAMLDLVDSRATPLRLPLGTDTYRDIRASLVTRLAEHDAHRETALSIGRDDLG